MDIRVNALIALGARTIHGSGDQAHPAEGEPTFTEAEIAAKIVELQKPAPRIFSKRKFFLALTDAEYEAFAAVEAQQPARDRRAFSEAVELSEADPDWPQFLALMHATYGEARAAEILDAAAI